MKKFSMFLVISSLFLSALSFAGDDVNNKNEATGEVEMFGKRNHATGNGVKILHVGFGNYSNGAQNSSAIGFENNLNASRRSTLVGYKNYIAHVSDTAIVGSNNTALGTRVSIFGSDNDTGVGNGTSVMGFNNKVVSYDSAIIGNNNIVAGTNNFVFGNNIKYSPGTFDTVALGSDSEVEEPNVVSIGSKKNKEKL